MKETKWTKKRINLCAEFWDDCAQESCEVPCERIIETEMEPLFYLIKCPFCGTGQQFENKAIGSHCNNPLCGAVVQSCLTGKHKGELMWFKHA